MRSPVTIADRRIAFWTQKADWPEAPPEYLFLGEVVGIVGQAVYCAEWTGLEPATELTTPLPAELLASVPTSELQRGCRILHSYDDAYRARCPSFAEILGAWPMPDASEWARAVDLAKELAEQQRIEFGRFIDVGTRLQQAFRNGFIHTAARHVGGGEMRPLSRWFWNTENYWSRFQTCRVHYPEPFNATAAVDGDSYIFVERHSLALAMSAPEKVPAVSGITVAGPEEYLSPYLRCMIEATRALKITADDHRKKDDILAELPKYWPGPGEPSAEDVDRMATLIREPRHKRGKWKHKQ